MCAAFETEQLVQSCFILYFVVINRDLLQIESGVVVMVDSLHLMLIWLHDLFVYGLYLVDYYCVINTYK